MKPSPTSSIQAATVEIYPSKCTEVALKSNKHYFVISIAARSISTNQYHGYPLCWETLQEAFGNRGLRLFDLNLIYGAMALGKTPICTDVDRRYRMRFSITNELKVTLTHGEFRKPRGRLSFS